MFSSFTRTLHSHSSLTDHACSRPGVHERRRTSSWMREMRRPVQHARARHRWSLSAHFLRCPARAVVSMVPAPNLSCWGAATARSGGAPGTIAGPAMAERALVSPALWLQGPVPGDELPAGKAAPGAPAKGVIAVGGPPAATVHRTRGAGTNPCPEA